jgi:hypothetical protein
LSGRLRRAAVAIVAGGGLVAQQTGHAQDREELARALGARDIAAQIQSLINFTALPDIATARFTITAEPPASDARLTTLKLPWKREWPLQDTPLRLYTEANLGLLQAEQEGATPEILIDARWRAISGLGGIGIAVPISRRLRVRPVFNLVYSYLRNDTDLDGPRAPELSKLLDDTIINYHVNAVGIGGTLEIAYEGRVEPYGIELTGSFSHLHTEAFEASSQLLETATDAQTFNARAELTGPTGFKILNRPVGWRFLLAGTGLTGSQVDALGFPYFIQAGGGLDIDISRDVDEVDRIGFQFAAVKGEGVSGYALELTLDF